MIERRGNESQSAIPVFFGGKAKIAHLVWEALGDPRHFIEPCFGSGAVLLGRPNYDPTRHVETVNDADGFVCVAPQTRILRDDLRWVNAGDITLGTGLLAFDEENAIPSMHFGAPAKYRHWQYATVIKVTTRKLPCYRLAFEDGTQVVASENHCWLSGSHRPGHLGGRSWRWIRTKSLVCNREWQRSWIFKMFNVEHQDNSYDSGWIAGFFDGEGHLIGRPGIHIGVTQNPNGLLSQVENYLKSKHFDFRYESRGTKAQTLTINGGFREVIRLLMLVRPKRLLKKLPDILPAMSIYGREHQAVGLVEKEYLGLQDVVAIATTSKTYIAEGLASHNCNAWRAMRFAPDEVARWCDWPVNHVDLRARKLALQRNRERLLTGLISDPKWHDAELAGYWIWGMSCWIGSGFMSNNSEQVPALTRPGRGVNQGQTLDGIPQIATGNGGDGKGINALGQRPYLSGGGGGDGRGINALGKRPRLAGWGEFGVNRIDERPQPGGIPHIGSSGDHGGGGHGVHQLGGGWGKSKASAPRSLPDYDVSVTEPYNVNLYKWFRALSERLRYVRVVCGDWSRVCGGNWQDNSGDVGLYFDPPYSGAAKRQADIYSTDSLTVADDIRTWCLERGSRPTYRIVLSGYYEEHESLLSAGWTVRRWKAAGGYSKGGSQAVENSKREALFLSPHCRRDNLFGE